VNPRFEVPAGGTEEFLGRERTLAVGVLVTACRPTPRSVFGAALRRELCEMNFPGAEDVRIALNRSDATTDQRENLSPSAVRVLTSEAISGFVLGEQPPNEYG